jgi:hypothetical protein
MLQPISKPKISVKLKTTPVTTIAEAENEEEEKLAEPALAEEVM